MESAHRSAVHHGSDGSRIPSLDGIRACAIWMVIGLHLTQRFGFPQPGTTAHRWLVGNGYGPILGDGVGVFFVLSGYLITTLLLREFNRDGTFSLRAFYERRCFRILPPLYAYLLFALIFCLVEHISFAPQSFISSAFFYRDYYAGANLWATEHTWSLSVEEQFYAIWPLLFLWGLKTGGRKRAARIAVLLILLSPIFRVAGKLSHIHYLLHTSSSMFHNRMDALMCGCLGAVVVGTRRFEAWYRRLSKVWWIFPLEFLVLSRAGDIIFGLTYYNTIGMTLDSACIAFFIIWASRNKDAWVGRILNAKIMVTMGVLSYSAYLWQTFYLHLDNPTAVKRLPYALLWIWITAWLSYELIEQPALRLRKRLHVRQPVKVKPADSLV
jgi:peptidoglycan/LPS O-acetylase OafA/YrhL